VQGQQLGGICLQAYETSILAATRAILAATRANLAAGAAYFDHIAKETSSALQLRGRGSGQAERLASSDPLLAKC